jgi:hypothetical protein
MQLLEVGSNVSSSKIQCNCWKLEVGSNVSSSTISMQLRIVQGGPLEQIKYNINREELIPRGFRPSIGTTDRLIDLFNLKSVSAALRPLMQSYVISSSFFFPQLTTSLRYLGCDKEFGI